MSKKIIHFQIPLLNDGIQDNLAISVEVANRFVKLMQKNLVKNIL